MEKNEDIALLVTQTAQGDKQAFNRLVERYYKKAYHYLRRMTAHATEAEDLVQEAFMTLWQKAHTFKADSAFEPWFYTILYHLSMDYHRSTQAFESSETLIEPQEQSPYQIRINEESNLKLETMLARLNPQERAVIVLFYYQQKNVKDIAIILATSEQAVQSLLYRGRKTLKRWWQGH